VFGWTLLAGVWVIAVMGIVLRSVWRQVPKYITSALYIALGWMTVLLVFAGVDVPTSALVMMAAGGVVYSAGFVIFVIEKPNPWPGVLGFHELWHLLVVGGALLHYIVIYTYVLPA
jgi:hemolysin III